MSSPISFIIHRECNSGVDGSGFFINIASPSVRSTRIRFRRTPSYDELLRKIGEEIDINEDEFVSRILYKLPIRIGTFYAFHLWNNDGVALICENIQVYSDYMLPELLVEVNKIAPQAYNRHDILLDQGTHLLGNADVGENPFLFDPNIMDDFNRCYMIANPAILTSGITAGGMEPRLKEYLVRSKLSSP